MMFRPCPSYPGYEASPYGRIRRAPTHGPRGKPIAAKLLKIKDHAWVSIVTGRGTRVADMVADAWPLLHDPERPTSDYPGGRVVRLSEWMAEQDCHADQSAPSNL